MTDKTLQFYECDNPDCRLRFPGYEGYPRSKRCPICRSSIRVAALVKSVTEEDIRPSFKARWKVAAILDNIRSAWNVGSIFRTADGTGVKKLYLGGITPTPENERVNKTALGAELNIPWEKHNNGVQLASWLKSNGHVLWALEDLPEAIPLFQVDKPAERALIVLVIGNEVNGIDPGIIELVDRVISIPMLGKKKSYNVAVAFGIAASFLLYRQSFSQGSRKILPST